MSIKVRESELINTIEKIVKEQMVSIIPPLAAQVGLIPGKDDEIKPAMTDNEFLGELDKLCPEINKKEKMVGNRSCARCHEDVMTLVRYYCDAVN